MVFIIRCPKGQSPEIISETQTKDRVIYYCGNTECPYYHECNKEIEYSLLMNAEIKTK
jgi:hypothetical protein